MLCVCQKAMVSAAVSARRAVKLALFFLYKKHRIPAAAAARRTASPKVLVRSRTFFSSGALYALYISP